MHTFLLSDIFRSVDVASELKLLDRSFKWVVEEGEWNVSIGGSSVGAKKMGSFNVTAA